MLHSRPCRIALLVLLLLAASHPAYAAKEAPRAEGETGASTIDLSQEEREFIKGHPDIRFSNVQTPPLSIIQPGGGYAGVLKEYFELVEDLTGLHFTFVQTGAMGDMKAVLDALEHHRVDMVNGAPRSPEHLKYALSAGPCLQYPVTVFTREGSLVRTIDQLAGKRVVVGLNSIGQQMLSSKFPSMPLIVTPTRDQAMRMVSTDLADATLGDFALLDYSIVQQGLDNVAPAGLTGAMDSYYSLVRQDWPLLASILQKAHDAIPDEAREAISSEWLLRKLKLVGGEVKLTATQKRYLEQHPIVTASNEDNYPPFNYNVNGQPRGYSIELLGLLAHKLGIQIKWISGKSWGEFLSMVRTGDLDLMCNMAVTPERKKYYTFTNSYTSLLEGIAYPKGTAKPNKIEDLYGKTVAVTSGFNEEESLRTNYPKLKLKPYPSTLDGLRALSVGEVDAMVDCVPSVQYLLKQYFITNVDVAGLTKNPNFPPVAIHFGMIRTNTVLRDILNAAMASLSPAEWETLTQRSLGDQTRMAKKLRLSEEELTRLSGSRFVTMCVNPDWPPYEMLTKDNRYEGMAADALEIMADNVGASLQVTPTKSYRESLEFARSHLCDIVAAVENTPEHGDFLSLTSPYLEFPYSIVTRSEEMFVDDLEKLGDHPLGVLQNSSLEAQLRKEHPGLKLVGVKSVRAGLEDVDSGKLYGMVSDIPTISHIIQENKLYNLKVAGKLPLSMEICVGVRKDDPVLVSIFNKAVGSLTPENKENIQKKWLSVTFEHEFDYSLLWRFLAGAVVVIGIIVYWNRKLSRLNRTISQARDDLAEAHGKMAALLDNSGQCFMSVGPDGVIDPEFSQECTVLFDGEVGGKSLPEVLHPEDERERSTSAKNLSRILTEEDEFRQGLYLSLLPKEMGVRDKQVRAEYRLLSKNKLMLVLTDVTERLRLEQALDRERLRLTFVVSAVKDSQDLFDILDELTKFLDAGLEKYGAGGRLDRDTLDELHRKVHTFKGLLLQMDFPETPGVLNEMETGIIRLQREGSADSEAVRKMLQDSGLKQSLSRDLELLEESLGQEFFDQRGRLSLPVERVQELELLAEGLLSKASELGLDRGERDLLGRIRQLRYIPVRRMLSSYPKASMQLAERLGKSIAPFEIEGGEFPVDPDRFAPLSKALVHVFRNAVDHGVEPPEDRLAAGKPESGKIECRVDIQDGRLVIEIADDGRGVDTEALRAKAVDSGLISGDEAGAMDKTGLLELSFRDGLSTAEQAGMISGRGVGLSAVLAETARLSGLMKIETQEERFTRIRIAIPLEPQQQRTEHV